MARSEPYRSLSSGKLTAWLPSTQETPAIKESIKMPFTHSFAGPWCIINPKTFTELCPRETQTAPRLGVTDPCCKHKAALPLRQASPNESKHSPLWRRQQETDVCKDQALSIVFPWFPLPQHFRASQLKHISPQDAPMRVGSAVTIWDNNSLHNRKPRVKSLESFRLRKYRWHFRFFCFQVSH